MEEAFQACRSISRTVGYDWNNLKFYTTVGGFTFICSRWCIYVFNDTYYSILSIDEDSHRIKFVFKYRSDGSCVQQNISHIHNYVIKILPLASEAFTERFSIERTEFDEPMLDILPRLNSY